MGDDDGAPFRIQFGPSLFPELFVTFGRNHSEHGLFRPYDMKGLLIDVAPCNPVPEVEKKVEVFLALRTMSGGQEMRQGDVMALT
jgi:hypothetical protein